MAALGLAALGASACIDEVVVGTQPSPITSLDGGGDAEPPEPDSGSGLDAQPPEHDATAPDAAPPVPDTSTADSSPPPSDAATDDGGPIVIVFFGDAGRDAGCKTPGCAPDAGAAPDAGKLGPCACNPAGILVAPDQRSGGCADELDQVCWQDPDGGCSLQCPPNPTCAATADCAPDEYCYFPHEDCGETSRGYCAPRPTVSCEPIGNPACGCDGRIYEKRCYALKAGVPIAEGPYAERCGTDGG